MDEMIDFEAIAEIMGLPYRTLQAHLRRGILRPLPHPDRCHNGRRRLWLRARITAWQRSLTQTDHAIGEAETLPPSDYESDVSTKPGQTTCLRCGRTWTSPDKRRHRICHNCHRMVDQYAPRHCVRRMSQQKIAVNRGSR